MARVSLLGMAAIATALALGALPAAADAIDGNWCDGRGKHLSIDGPKIRTPGGTEMTGDYERHEFSYVIPANEPGAGKRVMMILLDEETMTLSVGEAGAQMPDGPAETWRRCKLTT